MKNSLKTNVNTLKCLICFFSLKEEGIPVGVFHLSFLSFIQQIFIEKNFFECLLKARNWSQRLPTSK